MNMLDILKDTDGIREQKEPLIECFRCGICCSRYQVRLSLVEARRIANELVISWEKFLEKYTDHHWPGTRSFLLTQSHGTCIFLKQGKAGKSTSCLIHQFRPSSCREWKPSQYRPECKEGLDKYWGLKVSPEGKLQGNKVNIKRFQAFFKSPKPTTYS
jgi:Fe-S-cluster containining protein